jgi:Ca2+-binding RTX toxin-like protein
MSGGGGNDVLLGRSGDDLLFGDDGQDRFVFSSGDGDDVIGDFETGVDRIVLRAAADDFGDLAIADVGAGDVLISVSDISILLSGVTSTELDGSDFLF